MLVESRFDAVCMVRESLPSGYIVYRVDTIYNESAYPDKHGVFCRDTENTYYNVFVVCAENHVPYRFTVDANDGIGDVINWETGELISLESL